MNGHIVIPTTYSGTTDLGLIMKQFSLTGLEAIDRSVNLLRRQQFHLASVFRQSASRSATQSEFGGITTAGCRH